MEELIAKRYANALSSVLEDTSSVLEQLNVLTQAVVQEEIASILVSPIVSNEKKSEMIVASLGSETNSSLINFIKILGEKGRLTLIPAITKVLNSQQQRILNVYEGVVTSSDRLDETQLQSLQESLQSYTGSTINLVQESASIDGIKVSINDLGIEVNFSKQRVKEELIEFITKSL